jgi:small-conductance mechanosensitive channel
MHYLSSLRHVIPDELLIGLVVVVAAIIGLIAAGIVLAIIDRLIKQSAILSAFLNCKRLRPPVYTVMPVLLIFLGLRLTFPAELEEPFFAGLVKITSVALLYWLAMRIVDVTSQALSKRYDINVRDNLRARQVQTRIIVVRRIVSFIVFLVALSSVFLMFQELRTLGVSLLASAGIAGVVLGFAAQKTLGNLLAGFMIAISQPVRIEDAVLVEGQWGWIEEINLVSVVVRLWDKRRLILPISYLLEHPFENWTRTSADIIGEVDLFTDYAMPIEPLRAELAGILRDTDLWDGKTQNVQVSDCDKDVMKIRILVSAGDSGSAWDLRCLVRERMLAFISRDYPQCLPLRRNLISGGALAAD